MVSFSAKMSIKTLQASLRANQTPSSATFSDTPVRCERRSSKTSGPNSTETQQILIAQYPSLIENDPAEMEQFLKSADGRRISKMIELFLESLAEKFDKNSFSKELKDAWLSCYQCWRPQNQFHSVIFYWILIFGVFCSKNNNLACEDFEIP